MMEVAVELGARSYPIYIGEGLLHDERLVASLVPGSQVAIITNDTVGPLYTELLVRAFGNKQVDVLELPDGEAHKNFASFERVLDFLADHGHHRSTTVVALGGGVVGDMAGFAAATYQRGVNFVQVPTTLLAQVDSSVGGKTAINHRAGKNMIGAFYQPRAVLADVSTLATLPDRELRAGLAEVLKYGVIADAPFFEEIVSNASALLCRESDALARVIQRSCELKAQVVAEDERETGRRAILNFGHTFGHAIEHEMGYGELLHGEAVAIGMVMAADLSWRQGLLEQGEAHRILAAVQALQLPFARPERVKPASLLAAFRMDKKVLDGTVRFVLARAIGDAFLTGDIDAACLEATLKTDNPADG